MRKKQDKKRNDEPTNDTGLSFLEFIKENNDIPNIAALMWHLGVHREDFANEFRTLLGIKTE